MSNSEKNDKFWSVKIDPETCSICEVCAKHCPTGALKNIKEGDVLSIFFQSSLCNGCGGQSNCEELCPEKSIKLVRVEELPEQDVPVLLIKDTMIRCAYCDEFFTTRHKLDAVSKKGIKDPEDVYCPLCRRQNMVVSLIREQTGPGSNPEYRSAKHILRKAGRPFGKPKGRKRLF